MKILPTIKTKWARKEKGEERKGWKWRGTKHTEVGTKEFFKKKSLSTRGEPRDNNKGR